MNNAEISKKMDKVIENLSDNLRKLRTGRANSSLLETIKVEAYNTEMPLNQLATVIVVDYGTINIQPWDQLNLENIVKAINSSNIGLTGIPDSNLVRVNIPDLTEERRKELTKLVSNYEEEAKIVLRQIRKEYLDDIKKDKASTEDDIRFSTENIDKMIKSYNEKITEMSDKKRADMMTV